MKLLHYPDLVEMGIFRSRMTLHRAIAEQGFPEGRRITPNVRVWTEDEVGSWITSRPTAKKGSTRKPKAAQVSA